MFKDEITIDDVIEFIIKNCDNTELMDKISRVSFPFSSKYLNGDKKRKEREQHYGYSYNTTTIPLDGTVTLCSNSEETLSPNEE